MRWLRLVDCGPRLALGDLQQHHPSERRDYFWLRGLNRASLLGNGSGSYASRRGPRLSHRPVPPWISGKYLWNAGIVLMVSPPVGTELGCAGGADACAALADG